MYYDKNSDITPNQDLFENLIYWVETELRRNFGQHIKILPYIGVALKYGYGDSENRKTINLYFKRA
ncbi:hypothetical protein JXJ21_07620 [candidate division KSB1 bacterium]|nr:hypothetical protein [candidate division KSB1 bacterium]